MRHDDWDSVVDLMERVVGEDDLLSSVVSGVRTTVREVAGLAPADIAGHTRARQGVPIEAVLGAIHVAERAIWSRAREAAAAAGIEAHLLLDVRELYDDWAEAVRARLLQAHRAAGTGRATGAEDRDLTILRRLLEGGSAAALAAAEAGLPVAGGLWVLVARPDGGALEHALRDQPRALSGHLDGLLIGVLAQAPTARAAKAGTVAGLAGPAEPEELGGARRLALAALTAAETTRRSGVVHVADVAVLAALAERADLAAVLTERNRTAWTALGAQAEPVALAVRAWLEDGRDVTAAAERLFVHPNTVRNRVQRFTDVTGIDPFDTFGALNAWWLCRAWLGSGGRADVGQDSSGTSGKAGSGCSSPTRAASTRERM